MALVKHDTSLDEYLVRHYRYDPSTGVVSRNERPVGSGKIVGSIRYLRTIVRGRNLYIHRLCWRLHYGHWPSQSIDHKNGDGCDNRLDNLRLASTSSNMKNKRTYRVARDLPVGITSKETCYGTAYRAQVGVNGRCTKSRTFYDLDDAVKERQRMLSENGYHPLHSLDRRPIELFNLNETQKDKRNV